MNAQEWYEAGMAELNSERDPSKAERYFFMAVELQPNFPAAFIGRARMWLAMGNPQRCYNDCTRAMALDPQNTEPLLLRARSQTCLQFMNIAGALEDCEQALALEPASVTVYLTRAWVHAHSDRAGALESALADLNWAAELAPDCVDIYHRRSNIRWNLWDREGSLSDAWYAVQLAPTDLIQLLNLSFFLEAAGDLGGAMEVHNEIIRLDPCNPRRYQERGGTRVNQGDWQGAAEDFGLALEMGFDPPRMHLERGNCKFKLGDLDGAIEDLEQALKGYIERGDTAARRKVRSQLNKVQRKRQR